jgi:gliding motility-associated lipoprotein GldD
MKALLILILPLTFLFISCEEENPVPKPKGYFRIKLPEKNFLVYDKNCAFTFETPVYSKLDTSPAVKEPCWININYTPFDATLFLSYKSINNNLASYLEDARSLTYKHISKANDIDEYVIKRPDSKVYGLLYDVKGNAASSVQFYLTDSTRHFVRGALYFNNVPNFDSVSPVLDFLKKDISHFIETLEWK